MGAKSIFLMKIQVSKDKGFLVIEKAEEWGHAAEKRFHSGKQLMIIF